MFGVCKNVLYMYIQCNVICDQISDGRPAAAQDERGVRRGLDVRDTSKLLGFRHSFALLFIRIQLEYW